MWTFAVAFAAEPLPEHIPSASLVVDAKVPVELLLEGMKIGEMLVPSEISFEVPPGRHVLRVYVGGNATDVPLTLLSGQVERVLVGRTGISTATAEPPAASTGPQAVEFRMLGDIGARLRLDKLSQPVDAAHAWRVDLAPGGHPLSIRSADGTAIWATGELVVTGGAPIVVLLTEGRLPEVSGPATFRPAGG